MDTLYAALQPGLTHIQMSILSQYKSLGQLLDFLINVLNEDAMQELNRQAFFHSLTIYLISQSSLLLYKVSLILFFMTLKMQHVANVLFYNCIITQVVYTSE